MIVARKILPAVGRKKNTCTDNISHTSKQWH